MYVTATIRFCLCVAGLLSLLHGTAHSKPGWETARVEDGVTVQRLVRADNSLPAFLATGIVPGDLFDVLAVLNDVPRRTQWVAACAASIELQKTSDSRRVLYHRTSAPWPFADRDAVVQITVTLDRENKKATIRFKPSRTVRYTVSDEYVRMRIEGYYDLEELSATETRVKYYVDADPAGWIPKWLIRPASEEAPLRTIQGLRRRVRDSKASKQYATFLKRYREPVNKSAETEPKMSDGSQ